MFHFTKLSYFYKDTPLKVEYTLYSSSLVLPIVQSVYHNKLVDKFVM